MHFECSGNTREEDRMRATYKPTLKRDGVFVDEVLSGGRMLTGGKLQDIHTQSTVQNYDIGTRLVVDDRVFRYCHAGGILKGLFEQRSSNFPREGSTDAVIYAAGTYYVTIPMNANGDNYVAEQVKDYWKDGYIWVMQWPQVTSAGELYKIKSSAVAVGGFVTLTLYRPLIADIAASTWITAWPNPYAHVVDTNSARMSVICVPLIYVASGSYFWGQTWGPCFLSSGQSPGRKDYDRDLYFHPDKSSVGQRGVMPGSEVDFTTPNEIPQRAGFLITNTTAWTNADGNPEQGGDQFFMLQLSP